MRGWLQNGWSGGSGSVAEHVERGAAQLAGIQQGDQVVVDQVRAAGQVDDVRAVGEPLEVLPPQDAGRLGRQRQRVDQHVQPGQERGQLRGAGVGADLRRIVTCARVPAHAETLAGDGLRHHAADRAEPEHAHLDFAGSVRAARRPAAFRLAARVLVEAVGVAQHDRQRVLRHRARHPGVLETDQRHRARERRHRRQRVDAGAEVEDRLQALLLGEERRVRSPHERVVGGRRRVRRRSPARSRA